VLIHNKHHCDIEIQICANEHVKGQTTNCDVKHI